mgnify:CR=1 FL=1
MGVIADQFYAERLYTRDSIAKLLEKTGFRNVRHHGHAEALSDRDQDLGMMARRILLTADAPQLPVRKHRGQAAGARRHRRSWATTGCPIRSSAAAPSIRRTSKPCASSRMRCRSCRATSSATSTTTARWSGICPSSAPTWSSTCATKGWNNDPFKELHVPALLEVLGIGYTGAGPSALAACYDKGLVRAVAQGLDVPVPLESYVRPGDQGATLPSVFPGAAEAQPGRQQSGHHQGLRRHQREGPA